MKSNYLDPIKVIEITQPIGTFYVGVISAKQLLRVANKNLSRYKDVENGLQRDRSPKQINDIKKYLKGDYATFPNSIIINVGYTDDNEQNWSFIEESSELLISDVEDSVNIIDGQHRLFSLLEMEDFQLPVSIFLGLPLAEQGIIFSTINGNQRTVDSSLVYELFGMSKRRMIETVAYNVVSLLNEDDQSPWKNKIKMLGKAKNNGDISQGAFSKFIHHNLLAEGKVMRSLYDKTKDEIIYRIIFEYFSAIREVFPEEWASDNQLTKTTGFYGFMKFFIDLAKYAKKKDLQLTRDYFLDFISRSRSELVDFTSQRFRSGAVGQNEIRDILRSKLNQEEKNVIGIK